MYYIVTSMKRPGEPVGPGGPTGPGGPSVY